jgi:hypothetical protein
MRAKPDVPRSTEGPSRRSLIASRFARWGAAAPPTPWTRDASRDIKLGCQDHHPAAIAPRPPPSDPRPTERGARQLPRTRRRSRRWLSDTAGPPIGAVGRNSGRTRCRRWPTCWTSLSSGGTNCPPALRTARRRKRSMPCWSYAVMSKIFRPSSCQKASDGTDGTHRWRPPRRIRSSIDETIRTSLTTDQVETFGRCYLETIQR